jgi:carboxyl-terminal processing protease
MVETPVGSKLKSVAFITVKSFSSVTADEVTKAMENIHSAGPVDAIVIDLRNNGGGLLQGAVQTSNLFLTPGKIVVFVVSKEGRYDAQQTLPNGIDSTDINLPDLNTPLYILVNSNTASAAEVLAAALKVNARALSLAFYVLIQNKILFCRTGKWPSETCRRKNIWKRRYSKFTGIHF